MAGYWKQREERCQVQFSGAQIVPGIFSQRMKLRLVPFWHISRALAVLAPQTLVGHDARQKVPDSSGASEARGICGRGHLRFL